MAIWSDEEVEARSRPEPRDRANPIPRILALAALALVVLIAAGTVYSLAAGTRQKKLERESDKAALAAELKGRTSYTGIGTVRAKSADATAAAVVVATIAFPYDSADQPFSEELARKAPVLKAAAVGVLAAKKAAELSPAFEGALKAALREAFNARLSLGKVTEIWLSDFAVIQ